MTANYDEAGRIISGSLGTNPVTTTAFEYYDWDAASPGNSLGLVFGVIRLITIIVITRDKSMWRTKCVMALTFIAGGG